MLPRCFACKRQPAVLSWVLLSAPASRGSLATTCGRGAIHRQLRAGPCAQSCLADGAAAALRLPCVPARPQIKNTVLLLPSGSDKITGAPLQKLDTDKAVQDEEIKALLAVST